MNEPKFKVGDHVYEVSGTVVNSNIGLLTVTYVEWVDPTPEWPRENKYWLVKAISDKSGVAEGAEKYFIHADEIFDTVTETKETTRHKWFIG